MAAPPTERSRKATRMASIASGMERSRSASSSVITMGMGAYPKTHLRRQRKSQLLDLRHYLTAHQCERAHRLFERHRAEKQIAQQIIDAELIGLPLDFGDHGGGGAGDRHAVPLPLLEGCAARDQAAHLRLVLGVHLAQPI